jgi:hypothetical protein
MLRLAGAVLGCAFLCIAGAMIVKGVLGWASMALIIGTMLVLFCGKHFDE